MIIKRNARNGQKFDLLNQYRGSTETSLGVITYRTGFDSKLNYVDERVPAFPATTTVESTDDFVDIGTTTEFNQLLPSEADKEKNVPPKFEQGSPYDLFRFVTPEPNTPCR